MIDIHSHLIYGVDDGPGTIKESIRMILEAEKIGIKHIIATPHLYKSVYDTERAYNNLFELYNRVKDCDIGLYLGYEVFIDLVATDNLKEKRKITLNKSRYMLIELPFDNVPLHGYDTVYKLHLDNIIPIIAHPERNRSFVKDIGTFISFIEKGCLVQLDAASIVGVYGTEIKNFTKKLLKLNLVNFIASDAHCAEDYTEWYMAAYKKVRQWVGQEHAQKLFYENPKMIL